MESPSKVSFVICTLNCRDYVIRCLKSIRAQNYPQDKIEIIVVDSYSTDGTIEAAKSFGARVILTEKGGNAEGKGGPKAIGCEATTGDVIITVDSDNALVGPEWLNNMLYPLQIDPQVTVVICRMLVAPEDPLINQYCSLIGTDSFAAYCSMDSQLSLQRLALTDKGRYHTYHNTADQFMICGGYYLTMRRSTIDSVGGFTRDADTVYTLAQQDRAVVAIPKDTYIHHLITTGFWSFIRKKVKWSHYYFTHPDPHRSRQWAQESADRRRFLWQTIRTLLVLPTLWETLVMLVKDGRRAWWLHAPVSFCTTAAYIIGFVKSKTWGRPATP